DLLVAPTELDGPGAPDVVRALLLSALAPARPDQASVLMGGAELARRILPTTDVSGVEVCRDTHAALARLEVEIIQRTRLLGETDAPDFRAFARDHPEDPLPLLVVAVEPPPTPHRPRLDAIAGPAARLGIGILV